MTRIDPGETDTLPKNIEFVMLTPHSCSQCCLCLVLTVGASDSIPDVTCFIMYVKLEQSTALKHFSYLFQ